MLFSRAPNVFYNVSVGMHSQSWPERVGPRPSPSLPTLALTRLASGASGWQCGSCPSAQCARHCDTFRRSFRSLSHHFYSNGRFLRRNELPRKSLRSTNSYTHSHRLCSLCSPFLSNISLLDSHFRMELLQFSCSLCL
jgi:hypothetical protein